MMREDQTLPERAAPLSRVVDLQQPQIKLAEHESSLLLNVTSTGESFSKKSMSKSGVRVRWLGMLASVRKIINKPQQNRRERFS